MNRHVAIGLAVLAVLVGPHVWQHWRRRGRRGLPSHAARTRDLAVQELHSPSGRFKAVAFEHGEGAYRIEAFRLVDGEQEERFWSRVSGPSFADRASLASVLEDRLRGASGESLSD